MLSCRRRRRPVRTTTCKILTRLNPFYPPANRYIGTTGDITFLNSLTGFELRGLLSRSVADLFHPQHRLPSIIIPRYRSPSIILHSPFSNFSSFLFSERFHGDCFLFIRLPGPVRSARSIISFRQSLPPPPLRAVPPFIYIIHPSCLSSALLSSVGDGTVWVPKHRTSSSSSSIKSKDQLHEERHPSLPSSRRINIKERITIQPKI